MFDANKIYESKMQTLKLIPYHSIQGLSLKSQCEGLYSASTETGI